MTTERKKRIKIIILSVLAALLVFVAVCACVPFLRHRVLRVPIKTAELFPKPDEIICYHGGEEYTFTKEQTEALYSLFAEVTPSIENCLHAKEKPYSTAQAWGNLRWEFRYHDPYSYIGKLDTEVSLSEDAFTFNRITMTTILDGILFDPSLGDVSCDLYNGEYTGIILKDDATIHFNFTNMLEQFVLANLMGISPWQVANTEPLMSNTFPAKPDSILVYQDGNLTELSGEKLDGVYNKFTQSVDEWISLTRGYTSPGYAISELPKRICIEFRYNQRQKYVSDDIPRLEESFGNLSVEEFCNEKEYDALLFAVEATGYTGRVMEVAWFKNGRYSYGNMISHQWAIEEAFIEYLSTVLE